MQAIVGRFFKEVRKEKGENLEDVAPRADISVASLSAFERGKIGASLGRLNKYIIGYQLTVEEKERLQDLIIPIREDTEESLLFHRLINLSKTAYENLINAVHAYHLLQNGKRE